MAQGIVLVQLRISRTLYGRLRRQAADMGVALNQLLVECIREGRQHVEVAEEDEDEEETNDEEE